MSKLSLAAAAVLFIAGCAPLPRLTEADAATWGGRFDDAFVCKNAAVNEAARSALSGEDLETLEHNRQLWVKEVQRRGLLTPAEWTLVQERKIAAGMSLCALYAGWGAPTRENRTVVPGRVHIQHVYPARYSYNAQYVYTVNGRVTSYQETSGR